MSHDYPFQWVPMNEKEEEMITKLFPHDYSMMKNSVISKVRNFYFYTNCSKISETPRIDDKLESVKQY